MSAFPPEAVEAAAQIIADALSDEAGWTRFPASSCYDDARAVLAAVDPILRAAIAAEVEAMGRNGEFLFPEWTDAVARGIRENAVSR